ncbi:GntR family transcriptional regulator [Roseomonas sp. CAU 1739]|uniref:GntR family transcriptional regulator n=1 Tax=Roseomonas sp. CAU 1739 TaxID=3140364 RepID=UPI00325C082F
MRNSTTTSGGRARRNAAPPSAPASLPDRLAAEILEHVRRQRLEPGAHLSELGLAETFRVSRTPIRLALQALQQQGVVERERNRGFFLKQLPEGDAESEPQEDGLYFRIAEDHLSGALEDRMAESELLRRYGATRSQLLRVLARMTQEGLVEKLPGQGWAFLAVLTSPETYAQSYRFRILMEPAALLEPGYRLAPETIARLRAEQHAMLAGGWQTFSRAETHRIGAEFHEALVAGSGNIFMIESLRRVNRMRRLLEYRINHDRTRLVKICSEHLRLLDLIEAGDMPRAAAFLRQHLEGSQGAKEPLVQRGSEPERAPATLLEEMA